MPQHNQSLIDRLVGDINRRLPADLDQWRDEIARNIQAVLQESISRLELVGREEFDIQQQVLQRTREKLEDLQKRVASLEQQEH